MAVVYVCILHVNHKFFFSVDLLGLSYFIIIPCHTPLKQIRQRISLGIFNEETRSPKGLKESPLGEGGRVKKHLE